MKRMICLALTTVFTLFIVFDLVSCGGDSDTDVEQSTCVSSKSDIKDVVVEDNESDGEESLKYEKVQSIQYILGGEKVTLSSQVFISYTQKEVTSEEYDAAVNQSVVMFKKGTILSNGKVELLDRIHGYTSTQTMSDVENMIGKKYYVEAGNSYFVEVTYCELIISYINVAFDTDGSLYVQYFDSSNNLVTKKIKADSYEVQYFYQ